MLQCPRRWLLPGEKKWPRSATSPFGPRTSRRPRRFWWRPSASSWSSVALTGQSTSSDGDINLTVLPMGVGNAGVEVRPSIEHIGFSVEDEEATKNRLLELGASEMNPVHLGDVYYEAKFRSRGGSHPRRRPLAGREARRPAGGGQVGMRRRDGVGAWPGARPVSRWRAPYRRPRRGRASASGTGRLERMRLKFWGVRGSIPVRAPRSCATVATRRAWKCAPTLARC